MPIHLFARQLVDDHGISLVIDESLDARTITLDVVDQPIDLVLSAVSRRLGVDHTVRGSLHHLGAFQPGDRATLIRRVRRLSREDLNNAANVMLSEQGRIASFDDGLLVLSDRPEAITRISTALDQLEQAPADSWIIQLHLVNIRNADLSRFGLDVTPAADLALVYASGGIATGFDLSASLSALLRAERTIEGLSIITQPTFVISDGTEARLSDGDQIRLVQRAISPEGTVTVIGTETIQTGLDVKVGLRDLGMNRARLDLDFTLSAVVGGTTEAPTINRQGLNITSTLNAGGIYLLGSLQRSSRFSSHLGPLSLDRTRDKTDSTMLLWARLHRIHGDAR